MNRGLPAASGIAIAVAASAAIGVAAASIVTPHVQETTEAAD